MFRKVEKIDSRSVSVLLFRGRRRACGIVYSPEGAAKIDRRGEAKDAVVAVQHASALADKLNTDVAVLDPDDCWLAGWGTLEGTSNPV